MMQEPERILDPSHVLTTRSEDRLQHVIREWNKIPAGIVGNVEGHNISAAALHLERKKSACWPDLKDAFSSKAVAAEIFIDMLAQIPLPMNNSSPGYFDGMVEIAIFKFDPITRQRERSIRHPSVLKSEILTLGLLDIRRMTALLRMRLSVSTDLANQTLDMGLPWIQAGNIGAPSAENADFEMAGRTLSVTQACES